MLDGQGWTLERLHDVLSSASTDELIEMFRQHPSTAIQDSDLEKAVTQLQVIDAVAEQLHPDEANDIHSAYLQRLTTLMILNGDHEKALDAAADALRILVQEPRRRDERFLSCLALLLYDIAYLHCCNNEYKQAERAISKSLRIFERLAKEKPSAYGAAHLLATNASTRIYSSRLDQANLLAHYQVATTTYLSMLNQGMKDAGRLLVESLRNEGDTLMKMGKTREAIQFYTRAIKYHTKLNPDFSRETLLLSVKLGEALIQSDKNRQKGVHLLNTMLQKALKMDDKATAEQIDLLLQRDSTKWYDIFALWHKLFPR